MAAARNWNDADVPGNNPFEIGGQQAPAIDDPIVPMKQQQQQERPLAVDEMNPFQVEEFIDDDPEDEKYEEATITFEFEGTLAQFAKDPELCRSRIEARASIFDKISDISNGTSSNMSGIQSEMDISDEEGKDAKKKQADTDSDDDDDADSSAKNKDGFKKKKLLHSVAFMEAESTFPCALMFNLEGLKSDIVHIRSQQFSTQGRMGLKRLSKAISRSKPAKTKALNKEDGDVLVEADYPEELMDWSARTDGWDATNIDHTDAIKPFDKHRCFVRADSPLVGMFNKNREKNNLAPLTEEDCTTEGFYQANPKTTKNCVDLWKKKAEKLDVDMPLEKIHPVITRAMVDARALDKNPNPEIRLGLPSIDKNSDEHKLHAAEWLSVRDTPFTDFESIAKDNKKYRLSITLKYKFTDY